MMDILFALVGIIFLVTALAGFVFCVIFMARKIGFLKVPEEPGGSTANAFQGTSHYFHSIKNTLVFRLGLIVLLVLLLNIPLGKVGDIVVERNHSYHKVLTDIASTWGHKQTLQGPVLLIPYTQNT